LNAQARHDFVIGLSLVTPNTEFRHLTLRTLADVSESSTGICRPNAAAPIDIARREQHVRFVPTADI
jgi:hypothetical protein